MLTIKFKNTTDKVITLDAIGLDPVAPNGTIEVPEDLATPGRTDAGQRSKSPIECVAPQLEPADKAEKEAWMKTPPPPEPRSKIVSVSKRAPDEAPGVKALRELRAKQEAEAKAKAATPATK
jgi:hypothetical protein